MPMKKEPELGILLLMKEGQGEDIVMQFLRNIPRCEHSYYPLSMIWMISVMALFRAQIAREIDDILQKIGSKRGLIILTDNADRFTEKLVMDTFRRVRGSSIIISPADKELFESLVMQQAEGATVQEIALRVPAAYPGKSMITNLAEERIVPTKPNVVWGVDFSARPARRGNDIVPPPP
jgi:hypothetical protein